ncbi:hypothetical protein LR48_Vigan211s000900 [Vigna angularis]|uniref:Putative plant transposon protein domain-containing protein n=1 Tax=Phaseolus angularis TaxID=3914 RepID=A0A0L9T794_PHAAN|nr:hypothetical protein LR48_Vigan211s000900 [Vigna angularis]
MTSSLGKRIKTVGAKRKEPERPYSNKFLPRRHEQHFLTVQDRRLLMERKAGWIPDLAPQFGEELESRNWERITTYPTPTNIAMVKEFYTNARPLGDSHTEDYMSYVRGKIIRYDPDSINRFLHTEWTGVQCQFALNLEEGTEFMIWRVCCVCLEGIFRGVGMTPRAHRRAPQPAKEPAHEAAPLEMRDMYMSLMEERMNALYRGEQELLRTPTSAFPERQFIS